MAKFFQRLMKTETELPLESVHINARPRPDFNLERPAVAAVLDGRVSAPEHDQADALKNALNAVYGRNLEWASYFDAVAENRISIKIRLLSIGAFTIWPYWRGVAKIDAEIHDFRTTPLRCFTVPIAAERIKMNAWGQKCGEKVAVQAWELAFAELIACIDKALLAVRDGADLEAAFQPRAATALTN